MRAGAWRCGTIGRELGWAFQLVDDVLDYRGESGAMGKNTGDDLREGKMTLPVILALAEGTAAEREVIASALGRDRSAGRDGWRGAGDPREAPDAGADARQGARPYPDGAGCADGTAGVADAGDLVRRGGVYGVAGVLGSATLGVALAAPSTVLAGTLSLAMRERDSD